MRVSVGEGMRPSPSPLPPDPLAYSEQTIASMLDPSYWRAVCPWLSVTGNTEEISAPPPCPPSPSAASVAQQPSSDGRPAAEEEAVVPPVSPSMPITDRRGRLEHNGGFVQDCTRRFRTEGHFRVSAPQLETTFEPGVSAALARAVLRLVDLGHPPTAVMVYDEAWLLIDSVTPFLSSVTGNLPLGDSFTFCVQRQGAPQGTGSPPPGATTANGDNEDLLLVAPSPHGPEATGTAVPPPPAPPRATMPPPLTSGWAPHRDRPLAGEESFRRNGAPMYTTVWVPLTDATPESSCLYLVPAEDDPGYRGPGDNLEGLLDQPGQWRHIVAQPMPAGSMLCFSHRLVHWGSKPRIDAPVRIAMSFAFADPAFERPYYDASRLPLPPLGLRVGSIAAQQVMYYAQVPLNKSHLALCHRIFMSQRAFFTEAYVDKITSAAQFYKFMQRRS